VSLIYQDEQELKMCFSCLESRPDVLVEHFDPSRLQETKLSEHITKRLAGQGLSSIDLTRLIALRERLGLLVLMDGRMSCMHVDRLAAQEALEPMGKLVVRELSQRKATADNGRELEDVSERWLGVFRDYEGAPACVALLGTVEFGREAKTNANSVYVSYVDTLPEVLLDGTQVVHRRSVLGSEVLEAYLMAAAKQGFSTAALWSSARRQGDDYLFFGYDKRPEQGSDLEKAVSEWQISQVGLNRFYDTAGCKLLEKVSALVVLCPPLAHHGSRHWLVLTASLAMPSTERHFAREAGRRCLQHRPAEPGGHADLQCVQEPGAGGQEGG
jgi:hypothetical protein